MPIYEYRCEECGRELEMIQKVSDGPMKTCPSCRADSLKKKTSMSAFHLKGGGWYKDGYGTAGKEESKKEEKKTEEKTDKESKSDKKKEDTTKKPESGKNASTSPKTSKAS